MRYVYETILRLYPAEHRQIFASEMLATFRAASDHARKYGLARFLLFGAFEIAGLVKELLPEWFAKLSDKDRYVRSRYCMACETEVPEEIEALESRIRNLIRSMEYAIAHHDFPKARFYSDQERVTRAVLNRLLAGSRV